jgi:hypothetical protein
MCSHIDSACYSPIGGRTVTAPGNARWWAAGEPWVLCGGGSEGAGVTPFFRQRVLQEGLLVVLRPSLRLSPTDKWRC